MKTQKSAIKYLDVADIIPHPDNPRRDLGDLSELAESIRVHGVMENLVVIRNPDAVQRVAPSGGEAFERTDSEKPSYMAVIGHRRLAAAKLAGLKTVPCVIRDMSREEAVAAMLTENMQRSALTPWEEAKGFQQLKLDMGKSVADISALTGFGETTIRNRLKIAALDGEKVRNGLERGATLADLVELDGIRNPDLRSKTLEKAGTPDFRNAVKSALAREKRDALMKRWTAEASAFAERIQAVDHSTMRYVCAYNVNGDEAVSVEHPADAGERKYYYMESGYYLYVYREITAEDRRQEEAKAAALKSQQSTEYAAERAREAELQEITARHFQLRKEFIAECPCGKTGVAELVMRYAAETLTAVKAGGRYECDLGLLAELLDMESGIDFENTSREDVRTALLEPETYGKPCSATRLLLLALYSMNDNERNGFYKRDWNAKAGVMKIEHVDNMGLERLYRLLTEPEFGYEMSAEEQAMRDGTHELFQAAAEP